MYTQKQTQTMNLALKLYPGIQSAAAERLQTTQTAMQVAVNVQAIYTCKYSTTNTNVSKNDYTEMEQSIMNWDETTFVKPTLVEVKPWPMYTATTDVPESDCDCESEQWRRVLRTHKQAGLCIYEKR